MNRYIKKMIAPIIITIILAGYYITISYILINISINIFFQVIIIIVSIILTISLIYVLYSRIKEIRSGEEDDLSKY